MTTFSIEKPKAYDLYRDIIDVSILLERFIYEK